jgi:hypothetical protein
MTPASPCLEKTNKNQRNVDQIWKDGKEDGKEDGMEDGMLTWIRRCWSSIRSGVDGLH